MKQTSSPIDVRVAEGSTVKYRRWLPQFDPGLRTTVNISETYRGHSLQVFVAKNGLATATCAVYIDGKQAAHDIVVGTEPEVLVTGISRGMGLIDRLPTLIVATDVSGD